MKLLLDAHVGTMQDYNYVYAGCMEVTLELNCCKLPPADTIETDWQSNRDALLNYISQVDMG